MEIILDRAGFPMRWIPAINAYAHFLPVTKIQFEYFITGTMDNRFTDAWYREVLELNERVTPSKISQRNYWQAFITGIRPNEAQAYADWCGEGFRIPTSSEWLAMYHELKTLKPIDQQALEDSVNAERVKLLLKKMQSVSSKNNGDIDSAVQSYLRNGVMEWVDANDHDSDWGGLGQPDQNFFGSLYSVEKGKPRMPRNPDATRLRQFGFRLIKTAD